MKKNAEEIFEETTSKVFQNQFKKINPQIQEAQKTPRTHTHTHTHTHTPKHIIFKPMKTKEKNSRQPEEKYGISYKEEQR